MRISALRTLPPARGAVALALCAAVSCRTTTAPAPVRPQLAPGIVKRYQPLQIASDARRADLAVVLGTDGGNGSTVLPLPAMPTPIVVAALGLHRGGGAPTGVAQSIVLASRGAASAAVPAAPLQVDGADDSPAGVRWRATAWSAALVAATALGKDLADVALSATPAGPIDGTGSALIAAGFAAAMLGDTLDPAATLTGAIQPDGAIAPIAALPEQVTAALDRGKTRIGIPAGMRSARSATGKEVDLVRLARGRGADVVELAGVHDAYRLLTGHALPAPVPVAAAAMALDRGALDRLDAHTQAWRRKLADEWAPLLQLEQAGRIPEAIGVLLRVAHDRSEHAEALRRAGKLVGAYGDMIAGWLYAAAANRTHAVVGKLAAGDPAAASAALTALDTDEAIRAAFGAIAARQPATLAGHLAMFEALQAALRGWAYREAAAEALRAATQRLDELQARPAADRASPATIDAVAAAVAPAVLRLLRATAEAEIAEQELALDADLGAACSCAAGELTRAAAALQSATVAALGELEALVIAPVARRAGIAADQARWRVAAIEPDFLIADQLSRATTSGLPHELAASWAAADGAVAAGLLALAAPRAAYHSAALILAKYEALGVRRDDTGRIDAVHHPQALRALLATAERSARAAARTALVATGAVPLQARLAYQVAVAGATGTLDDQLDALGELWTATAFSEAAVILARGCRPSPASPLPGPGSR